MGNQLCRPDAETNPAYSRCDAPSPLTPKPKHRRGALLSSRPNDDPKARKPDVTIAEEGNDRRGTSSLTEVEMPALKVKQNAHSRNSCIFQAKSA